MVFPPVAGQIVDVLAVSLTHLTYVDQFAGFFCPRLRMEIISGYFSLQS